MTEYEQTEREIREIHRKRLEPQPVPPPWKEQTCAICGTVVTFTALDPTSDAPVCLDCFEATVLTRDEGGRMVQGRIVSNSGSRWTPKDGWKKLPNTRRKGGKR